MSNERNVYDVFVILSPPECNACANRRMDKRKFFLLTTLNDGCDGFLINFPPFFAYDSQLNGFLFIFRVHFAVETSKTLLLRRIFETEPKMKRRCLNFSFNIERIAYSVNN